jgi:hypothetical protein
MCVAHFLLDESYGSLYNLGCNKKIYCWSLHYIHVVCNIIHQSYCTSYTSVAFWLRGCCPKFCKCFWIVNRLRGRTPRHMWHKHKYHKNWPAFAWASSHFHSFKSQTFICFKFAKESHWLFWASMWPTNGAPYFSIHTFTIASDIKL